MTDSAVRETSSPAPAMTSTMTPTPYRVTSRVRENGDSVTLRLEPVSDAVPAPAPGQFMMLYAFGVGEIAISVSGVPTDGTLMHTIRAVGAVSRALCAAGSGAVVGVRGPFGTRWGLEESQGRDLLIVAGGVGLAPLRPVLVGAMEQRDRYGKIILVAGARSRNDFLFAGELAGWQHDPGIQVHTTVDVPVQGWHGEVGLVTGPLRRLALAPDSTTAFLCGPEPMMRFSAEALLAKGLHVNQIRVSLERNMQCGLGWCGHCQLGPLLLCRDGPVVSYDVAYPLLVVKEL